jgi:NitT/TauT family transport system ATP-binding protein/sulfonate transport system ATP-binding protein
MDEPFGALDFTTPWCPRFLYSHVETRRILASLRGSRKHDAFVTHDIDEAIYMSGRIVIMTPRPGKIEQIITVDLNPPRDRSIEDSLRPGGDILKTRHFAG